jgi:hypothetical protein
MVPSYLYVAGYPTPIYFRLLRSPYGSNDSNLKHFQKEILTCYSAARLNVCFYFYWFVIAFRLSSASYLHLSNLNDYPRIFINSICPFSYTCGKERSINTASSDLNWLILVLYAYIKFVLLSRLFFFMLGVINTLFKLC